MPQASAGDTGVLLCLFFYPEIDGKHSLLNSFFLNNSLLSVLMQLDARKSVLFTSTNNLRKLCVGRQEEKQGELRL